MVMDLRCSYCSNKITVRAVQPMDGELKIRCPGCKNILIVKVFSDGTYGEVVHEMGEIKKA